MTSNAARYIPPSMRRPPAPGNDHGHHQRSSTVDVGGGSVDMLRRQRRNVEEEKFSVRVSNLSEDTREADLLELFCHFGPVIRAHVALDRKTGASRGYGFVDFASKGDAEMAISKLDGYGYDNLILSVDWATNERTCSRS